jgi:putative heme transporter
MTDDGSPKKRFALPRHIRLLISAVVVVFILEYVVVPQFASASRVLHHLSRISPVLIVFAVVAEAIAILAYSELTRTVFAPHAPRRIDILRVNLSTLAISHIFPGGTAPASALSYRLFSEMGVPASTNAFGLAFQGAGSAVILNVLFWLALVISIPLRGFNPYYGFAALVGVFLMLVFFGAIFMILSGNRNADSWLRGILARLPKMSPERAGVILERVTDRITMLTQNRRLLWNTLAWATANWLLDAASLWIFLAAFGFPISPVDLMVAYGLANILAVIPITPAGLGVIELFLIPTLVGFGVPHADALVAVLTYRFVNFWLPIPIGGVAYLSLDWIRPKRLLPPTASSGGSLEP